MANPLFKLVTKTLSSTATTLVSSELKKHAKNFLEKVTSKSPETINKEVSSKLGYLSEHFTLDKKQNIVFKSSSILMREWLSNSPSTSNKIIKDEETNQVFFNEKELTNSIKVELLSKFTKATGINSPAVSSHFDQAIKLLDASDFTAKQFAKEFSSWNPSNPSVIDSWLTNCFGSALETDAAYANMLFKKWIVGTAHRAMKPGFSFDGCLVLQGPTSLGKTLFFRNLLPEPFHDRTGEIYCDLKSPAKFVESIVGKTVACFDELSVLEHDKTLEIFKQLLTSQFIDVRLAWARKAQRFALRAGFSGTTNKPKFITDKTLSRRLWVIELNSNQRLNFDFHEKNKRSLWQEAVFLALSDKEGKMSRLSLEEHRLVEDFNKKFLALA